MRPVYNKQEIINSTFKWVDNAVIGHGLCPFAASIRRKSNQALRCHISEANDLTQLLTDVRTELNLICEDLEKNPDQLDLIEGSLLVIPSNNLKSINNNRDQDQSTISNTFLADYRSFVHASWEVQAVIEELGLSEKIQIVLFHPKAVHSLYRPEDHVEPADYAIRSPYPTLHFLREKDILSAVKSNYNQPELIPERNAKKLGQIGLPLLEQEWALFSDPTTHKS